MGTKRPSILGTRRNKPFDPLRCSSQSFTYIWWQMGTHKSHALGRGKSPKVVVNCALSSHPPRAFSVPHVPSLFHGGNNCSVSPDRRFVAKSDQPGFLGRARLLFYARSSRLSQSSLPYKSGTITSATAPGAANPTAREDWFARKRRSITSRTEQTSKIGVTWVMFSKFAP